MNILTVYNEVFDVNSAGDEIGDVRFSVLDCSDPSFIDYYFYPLVFLESYYAAAVVLDVGGVPVKLPLDKNCSLLVCDEEMNEVEIMNITKLNDRGFNAFVYNPLSNTIPRAIPVQIDKIFTEVKWFTPKLKPNCMLTIPLVAAHNPPCVFFVNQTKKFPKSLSIGDLF